MTNLEQKTIRLSRELRTVFARHGVRATDLTLTVAVADVLNTTPEGLGGLARPCACVRPHRRRRRLVAA